VNTFPVRRGEGDVSAIKTALKLLKTGRPLVIFPEGTRTEDRQLQRGKPGIGLIVAKAGVPVVPAYIEGSFDAMPRGTKRIRRSPVKVYIGKPIYFKHDITGKLGREAYQKISDRIMAEIALLKESCETASIRREPLVSKASVA